VGTLREREGCAVKIVPTPTVYLDESGFTGVDLLHADQPVFVSASNALSAEEAQLLLDSRLGVLPRSATQWSHSSLVASDAGRRRLVALIRDVANAYVGRAVYYAVNKRFALLAKMIDNWIEPAMHHDGFNLYEAAAP
jgi:hypothetical protein